MWSSSSRSSMEREKDTTDDEDIERRPAKRQKSPRLTIPDEDIPAITLNAPLIKPVATQNRLIIRPNRNHYRLLKQRESTELTTPNQDNSVTRSTESVAKPAQLIIPPSVNQANRQKPSKLTITNKAIPIRALNTPNANPAQTIVRPTHNKLLRTDGLSQRKLRARMVSQRLDRIETHKSDADVDSLSSNTNNLLPEPLDTGMERSIEINNLSI